MITSQEHMRARFLYLDEAVEHLSRIGAAVYVISQKDQPIPWLELENVKQGRKRGEGAMDVPDRQRPHRLVGREIRDGAESCNN